MKTMKKRVVLSFVFQRGMRVKIAKQNKMKDTLEFDNLIKEVILTN